MKIVQEVTMTFLYENIFSLLSSQFFSVILHFSVNELLFSFIASQVVIFIINYYNSNLTLISSFDFHRKSDYNAVLLSNFFHVTFTSNSCLTGYKVDVSPNHKTLSYYQYHGYYLSSFPLFLFSGSTYKRDDFFV